MPPTAVLWLLDARGIGTAPPGLSAAETLRLGRFMRPARRRQFLLGRLLLRYALGTELGIDAAAVELTETLDGPPRCAGGAAPWASVSHSGDWIACAVSAHTQLGLDIERPDPARDVLALAAQVFAAGQVEALAALAPPARTAAFYREWCMAEARIKLAGNGGRVPGQVWMQPHPQLAIALCSETALTAVTLREIDVLLPRAVVQINART